MNNERLNRRGFALQDNICIEKDVAVTPIGDSRVARVRRIRRMCIANTTYKELGQILAPTHNLGSSLPDAGRQAVGAETSPNKRGDEGPRRTRGGSEGKEWCS